MTRVDRRRSLWDAYPFRARVTVTLAGWHLTMGLGLMLSGAALLKAESYTTIANVIWWAETVDASMRWWGGGFTAIGVALLVAVWAKDRRARPMRYTLAFAIGWTTAWATGWVASWMLGTLQGVTAPATYIPLAAVHYILAFDPLGNPVADEQDRREGG